MSSKALALKVPYEGAELALKALKGFFKQYPNHRDGIVSLGKKSFYVYQTKTQLIIRPNHA